jgi:ABC-type transporter Mla maintaining outer membrane lipid asymmetry ATPase subunit MlaF
MSTAAVTETRPQTQPAQAEPVLEMVGVWIASARDPQRVVFEEVNWTVYRGEFWAIGGLHGSGKTDFMAMAAGLTRPVRGTYRLFGRELPVGFEPELLQIRRRISLVFDGGRLLSGLTVAENVALPIRYHRAWSEAEVAGLTDRLLAATGLTRWAGHLAGSISYQWQQRTGLARALALQPEVLLLDSPLSGLDPFEVGWWLDFLTQLSVGHPLLEGRPLTLALTCDDLRLWQGRANRFAVLRQGRFVPLPPGATPPAPADLLRMQLNSEG